jgi:all-trans-retinol dehydrogenase (NAD+)
MTNVKGKTVLITGGASGIGRLLALELVDRGARVVVWDLKQEALDAVLPELHRTGQARGYVCDVSDPAMVSAVAERVRADVGDPHVVVNNAGVVSGARLLDLSERQITKTFDVNTLALYWVTKAFLPAMVARDEGHVVTVASAAGLVGVAKQTDYSASKHAAVGFDESLRAELRREGSHVRTTVVCPFYVDTGMFQGVRTRVPWLLPILAPEKVAGRIARAIERDHAVVIVPPIIRYLLPLRVLPTRAYDWVADLFGVNVGMDEFVGRPPAEAPHEAEKLAS